MKTKPKLNVRLLRKIQRYILKEPRRLVMSRLILKKGDPLPEDHNDDFGKCGTAACIAGWALLLSGRKPFKGERGEENDAGTAAKVLGVKYETCGNSDHPGNKLFWVFNWPYKFRIRYNQAKTAFARAKATSLRIDYFIKHRK
jgi:hypothetical protein